MLKRLGVIVVWLLATLGTASLTYAAVSQADRAVGDAPAVPVAAADIAARVSTTVPVSSTLPAEPSTTTPAGVTTTSVAVTTSTTTLASSSATGAPGTTIATSTSSGTTQAAHTEYKTIPGVGTVGVSVSGDSVTLLSVQPVAPYDFEVEHSGPEQVEVEFWWGENEHKVRAEAEDGVVAWQVEG